MTEQEPLFFETAEDAARHVVQVLGGCKAVGALMRPAKSPDQAARWLSDCLNPERHEGLKATDLIWLAREGRKANCHALIAYLAGEAGYTAPTPLQPQDEQAALMREFILAARTIRHILPRLEEVGGISEMQQQQIRPVR